jgi:alanine-synthesizing transaminase
MFVWAPIPEPYAETRLGGVLLARVQASARSRCPRSRLRPGGEGFARFALIENEQRIAQGLRNLRKGLTKLG